MSRYMDAISLLIRIKAMNWADPKGHTYWRDEIQKVLDSYESPGEVAIREGDEMIEEALRMNF